MKFSNRFLVFCIIALTFVFGFYSFAFSVSQDEANNQGELLAELLVAGRGVVAQSLPKYKINDPEIADKGFKPEYFKTAINEEFKKNTGIDILAGTSAKPISDESLNVLKTMLDASEKVCEDNQTLINMKGVGFKGFIPASYGRMVSEIMKEKTGIVIKQTTFVFRNTYNAPDNYEQKILKDMEAPEYKKGEVISALVDGKFRVMKPIYIQKACLSCHGDPKGEIDVAGRKKEGYKEGDLRGAISVMIDVK